MKIKNLCFGYTIILMVLSGTCVFAQDWPQWRGINRDDKVTGFTPPENWPTELTQKWKITVGAGDATPALVDNKLYVFTRQGDDEVTLCLDANDGKELWRDQYTAQPVTGAASRHPGPRSSPAVIDGKVVTIGVGGILSCLDAATGKVVWRKEPFPGVVPKFFTAMSPMIVDGTCIAHLGSAGNGAIIAYDLKTGDEKWRWAGEGPEYASPALLTVGGTKQIVDSQRTSRTTTRTTLSIVGESKQIVTLAEKSIVGVDAADGKLLWQLPFTPQGRAYNAATPIIDGQTVIYTGASRGTMAVNIERQGDSFVAKELWSNKEADVQFNTPVLKGGLLFGLTSKDNLFCLNAQTGQTAWINTERISSGGFGAILDAGSVMLFLSSNSQLIAFEPSGKEYKELARIKVADAPTYAHPVIAGDRIYVKDETTLALWMLK